MRIILSSLSIILLGVPMVWACMPEDANRATEVAFNKDEVFDLEKLTVSGTEDVNYRVESQEKDELFPSDQPVVVYRSHFDSQVMVKIGFSPSEYEWRSVLIVLSEWMDPETFDFASAMQKELTWLIQRGAIVGLDAAQIPTITRELSPGGRFFTQEMVSADQGCVAPGLCMDCIGERAYTRLPPESLDVETAVDGNRWGGIKARMKESLR